MPKPKKDRITRGGYRLKELREEAGLSMDELAAACHPPTTSSQISKLEKGGVKLSPEWARRLAPALQVYWLEIYEPLPKLDPQETELLEHYRHIPVSERGAAFTVITAMSRLPNTPANDTTPETPPPAYVQSGVKRSGPSKKAS